MATIKSISLLSILHNLIPITLWLPNYDLRNNLVGDLISGFTVSIMHIPQGMAYGILALVTPEVGLYMAFFPVLVYFLLGTSRHASLGTFAVISIMVSKTVQTHAYFPISADLLNATIKESANNNIDLQPPTEIYTPLEVVTALSLMVGIYHLIMFVCRMGALSSLLSEPLVSGFTTGAAVHVFVNQLKDILGVTVTRHQGAFKIVYVSKFNHSILLLICQNMKQNLIKNRFPIISELNRTGIQST